jgi:hypothetical protein
VEVVKLVVEEQKVRDLKNYSPNPVEVMPPMTLLMEACSLLRHTNRLKLSPIPRCKEKKSSQTPH